MQPAALSLEPVILFSALIFLAVILPSAVWITWRCGPRVRIPAVVIGATALVFLSFSLGHKTGLSMAWYHWRAEYKDPLWEWQIKTQDYLGAGNTNALIRAAQIFTNENIQAYGREKLFNEGAFKQFVTKLPTQ